MTQNSASYPRIEELVPHRGMMLLLDRVLACDESAVLAETTVASGKWYSEESGAMPSWIGLELMAQAVAAHVGLLARLSGRPPKQGVLLGVKALRAAHPRLAAEERLEVAARVAFRDESGLGAYDCAICTASGELMKATLKVFEPPDFQAFLDGIRS